MNGWLSPFEAFTQNAFPFPSIEIKNKPALKLRAGLSSLGELVICFSRGEMFSFVPQCVTGHRLDAGGIPTPDCTGTHPAKLECRAKGVRVLDTPWGTPERCARASGLRRVCDAFDANMLVWPTRTSEYVFAHCPAHPSLVFISLKPPWKRTPSFLLHTPCLTWTVPNRNSCCICSWDSSKSDMVFQLLHNMKM